MKIEQFILRVLFTFIIICYWTVYDHGKLGYYELNWTLAISILSVVVWESIKYLIRKLR
jgi:hypothetical protein